MTQTEKSALATAIEAHAGQHRMDGKPFVTHPIRVYNYLRSQGCPEYVCIAGLLHDVVEDGGMSMKGVSDMFGSQIRGLVEGMTISFLENKDDYFHRFKEEIKQDQWLMIIKLADRFDNLCDMELFTPEKIQKNIDDTINRLIPLVDISVMTPEQARIVTDLCQNIEEVILAYSKHFIF